MYYIKHKYVSLLSVGDNLIESADYDGQDRVTVYESETDKPIYLDVYADGASTTIFWTEKKNYRYVNFNKAQHYSRNVSTEIDGRVCEVKM